MTKKELQKEFDILKKEFSNIKEENINLKGKLEKAITPKEHGVVKGLVTRYKNKVEKVKSKYESLKTALTNLIADSEELKKLYKNTVEGFKEENTQITNLLNESNDHIGKLKDRLDLAENKNKRYEEVVKLLSNSFVPKSKLSKENFFLRIGYYFKDLFSEHSSLKVTGLLSILFILLGFITYTSSYGIGEIVYGFSNSELISEFFRIFSINTVIATVLIIKYIYNKKTEPIKNNST